MKLRIALVAGPMLPVPPPRYGGTERVIAALGDELHARGHAVTLFASGDSCVPYELVTTVPSALWPAQPDANAEPYLRATVARVWEQHDQFDIIHSHIEFQGLELARRCPTPVISTLHGRVDLLPASAALDAFEDVPVVAISEAQRRGRPAPNWVATIHHGLPLVRAPFEATAGTYLLFVGRLAPEKGVSEAIELGRLTRTPLRMAAKVQNQAEHRLFRDLVQPAIAQGGVTFFAEPAPEQRDRLYAGALATVMMGNWPEPFGLVAIESLASGTPVIAKAAGALPEIVENGITGFVVDDLAEASRAVDRVRALDRRRIRSEALRRFSVERMTDQYVAVYRSLLDRGGAAHAGDASAAAHPSSSV